LYAAAVAVFFWLWFCPTNKKTTGASLSEDLEENTVLTEDMFCDIDTHTSVRL